MKICIVGAFGFKYLRDTTGGQPVKTRELYYLLKNNFNEDNIKFVDMYKWKKHPFKVIFTLIKNIRKSDRIVMLPAHNGVKVFSVLIPFFKKRKTRLYYDVIGGWLPEATQKSEKLKNRLLKFDGIWVETNSMKEALAAQGFKNISIVPNFKNITPLKEDELIYNTEKPFKFCYFARVAKEKGIEDAVTAIKEINKKYGAGTAELDIYGQVNPDYEEGFKELQKSFDGSINYKGVVKPEKSVETLKDYFALLFPTYYRGEGFAGTLIDALFSGLPVISSDWKYNSEVVENNITGLLFPAKDTQLLKKNIEWAIKNADTFNGFKINCLNAAEKYQPQNIAGIISYLLNLGR